MTTKWTIHCTHEICITMAQLSYYFWQKKIIQEIIQSSTMSSEVKWAKISSIFKGFIFDKIPSSKLAKNYTLNFVNPCFKISLKHRNLNSPWIKLVKIFRVHSFPFKTHCAVIWRASSYRERGCKSFVWLMASFSFLCKNAPLCYWPIRGRSSSMI